MNISSNDYFDDLSPSAEQFFLDNGIVPKNESEANRFLMNIAIQNADKIVYNNTTFDLETDDYIYALYPEIWKTTSISQRAYIIKRSFDDLCKSMNINFNCKFKFFTDDNEIQDGGCAEFDIKNKFIFMPFDMLFDNEQDNFCEGLILYSLLAHELEHALQYQRSLKIIKNDFKGDFPNYLFCLKKIGDDAYYDGRNYYKDSYLDKYNSLKKDANWNMFTQYVYNSHRSELESGKVQYDTFAKISKLVFQKFGKDSSQNIYINKWLEKTADLYSEQKAQKLYYGNMQFVQKLDNYYYSLTTYGYNLLHEYYRQTDKTTEQSKQMLLKLNDSKADAVSCLNALLDLYCDRSIPKNFDQSKFVKTKDLIKINYQYELQDQERKRKLDLEKLEQAKKYQKMKLIMKEIYDRGNKKDNLKKDDTKKVEKSTM